MNSSVNSLHIEESNSPLAFEWTTNEWPRYLTLKGKRAYFIGGTCETCAFLFERLEGANKSVSPQQVSEELKLGLHEVGIELLNEVSAVMPKGEYLVKLLEVSPKLVTLGSESDYFCNEQVDLWGID